MIVCCAHKPVPCLVINREFSSSSRSQALFLESKLEVSIGALSSEIREPHGLGEERIGVREDGGYQNYMAHRIK